MKPGDLVKRKSTEWSQARADHDNCGIVVEEVKGTNPYIYYMVWWGGNHNSTTPLTENQLEMVSECR